MRERTARIADPGLRQKMAEGLDALVGSKRDFGDHSAELMSEIGAKNLAAIELESSEAKARAEKKRERFERAVRTVAEASEEEDRNMGGFRQEVVHAEGIARDNLAYFRDNGFLAFGSHFDAFLTSVNRNQLAISPSADGLIALPKELSESDRALLAH